MAKVQGCTSGPPQTDSYTPSLIHKMHMGLERPQFASSQRQTHLARGHFPLVQASSRAGTMQAVTSHLQCHLPICLHPSVTHGGQHSQEPRWY